MSQNIVDVEVGKTRLGECCEEEMKQEEENKDEWEEMGERAMKKGKGRV